MPPTTNFKTYESQARLLAAVVAAHPELKLNYKAIAEHNGGTTSSIEHRFRPVKEQAKALRVLVAAGQNPEELDVTDKDEIARIFAGSTPDGMNFQFRAIKKQGKELLDAANGVETNGSPATPKTATPKAPAKNATTSKAKATPRKPIQNIQMDTPTSKASSSRGKRQATKRKYEEVVSSKESEADVDYEELDGQPFTKKLFPKSDGKNGAATPREVTMPQEAEIETEAETDPVGNWTNGFPALAVTGGPIPAAEYVGGKPRGIANYETPEQHAQRAEAMLSINDFNGGHEVHGGQDDGWVNFAGDQQAETSLFGNGFGHHPQAYVFGNGDVVDANANVFPLSYQDGEA